MSQETDSSIPPLWKNKLLPYLLLATAVGMAVGAGIYYPLWLPKMNKIREGKDLYYNDSDNYRESKIVSRFCPSECLNDLQYCGISKYGLWMDRYGKGSTSGVYLYCDSPDDDGFTSDSNVVCIGSTSYNTAHSTCFNVNQHFQAFFDTAVAGFVIMIVLASISFVGFCWVVYKRSTDIADGSSDSSTSQKLLDQA